MNVPCIGLGDSPGLAAAVRKLPRRLEYALAVSAVDSGRRAGWTAGARKLRDVTSSLHSSGSLYINFGLEKRPFSRLRRISAMMSAINSGAPIPAATPASVVMETVPPLSAHCVSVGAADSSDSVPTRAAICDGRRAKLVSAGSEKVSLLQSPLRPQANALLSVSVEQGVIAISEFGLTAVPSGQRRFVQPIP